MGVWQDIKSIVTPVNMIITMTNIIFFMVVQTLFFKFIASKQFNNVLADKVDILNRYLVHDSETRGKMKNYLESDEVAQLKKVAKEQEKKREKMNLELIKKWIGIPLSGAVALLLFFIYQMKKQGKKFTGPDKAILSLVVGAYTTELLFYFGIVRQYKFYGDHRIYRNVYLGLKEKLGGQVRAIVDSAQGSKETEYLVGVLNLLRSDQTAEEKQAAIKQMALETVQMSPETAAVVSRVEAAAMSEGTPRQRLSNVFGVVKDQLRRSSAPKGDPTSTWNLASTNWRALGQA